MAKAEVSKTPLSQRLRAIRSKLGDPDRDEFCLRLGISRQSLGNYERGDRVPDSTVLAAYRQSCGIDINWLLTGAGDMFEEENGKPEPPAHVDPWALERLYVAVEIAYRDIGRPISANAIAREAAALYNLLLTRVVDVGDRPIVEAVLPILAEELKERLRKAEPGSGKHSA